MPEYKEIKYRDGLYYVSLVETKPTQGSSLIEGRVITYEGKRKNDRGFELISSADTAIFDSHFTVHTEGQERNSNSTELTQNCAIDSTTGVKTTGNNFFPEREQINGSLPEIRELILKELEQNGTLEILLSIKELDRSPLFHEMLEKLTFKGKQY